jgi:hypothetical protein
MTTYRGTRNENRVGVGEWTGDIRRGEEYESGDRRDQIPEYICDYLVSHGILVDARTAEGPMGAPAPPSSPAPPKQPIVRKLEDAS